MSIEQLIDDAEKDIWQVMGDPEDISVRKTAEQIVESAVLYGRFTAQREHYDFVAQLMKEG